MSVTWYVIGVLVPCVALASATNVTTPVATFNVYVPSPAIVTMPSASHVVVFGVSRQVADVLSPAGDVASAPVPVSVVNVAVPPGITALDSGVATGALGAATVGVTVALATWPVESVTTYFTGVAVPLNVGRGSNVTVPFAFTVYVPSPATVRVVRLQLALAVLVVAHNFTLLAIKVAGDVTVSFVKMEIV
jgi:hypothetical protein